MCWKTYFKTIIIGLILTRFSANWLISSQKSKTEEGSDRRSRRSKRCRMKSIEARKYFHIFNPKVHIYIVQITNKTVYYCQSSYQWGILSCIENLIKANSSLLEKIFSDENSKARDKNQKSNQIANKHTFARKHANYLFSEVP